MNIYRENIFPVLNELATRQFSLYRRQLLSQVPQQAEVLEIGFGTGTSIAEYQPKIKMLTALEPNSGMLARAKKNPTLQAKFRINLIEGACEALPSTQQASTAWLAFLLCAAWMTCKLH